MNKKFLRLAAVIVIVVISAHLLHIRTGQRYVSASSAQRMVMGTFANIIAVAADADTAEKSVAAAYDKLVYIDSVMSDYRADSELSRVNRDAFNGPVKVCDDLFEVLSLAVEYSEKSKGAFDITVGPLVDLWKQAGEKKIKPTPEQIAEATQKVGFEKLILDAKQKTLRFAVDGMRLDLGGIAKGYAIDLAVEAMRQTNAVGGMIDVGGDIRCFGAAPKSRKNWCIGLQNPDAEDILLKLNLSDMAVATSGDYRRFVVIDGQRHSHIVNPQSPAAVGEVASVSIIAPTAIQADALATAVSVLGREEGLKLIRSIENTEAVIIDSDSKQFTYTDGVMRYIDSAPVPIDRDK